MQTNGQPMWLKQSGADRSPTGLHAGFYNGQAEAGATRAAVAGEVDPIERVKQPGQLLRRHAGYVVGDLHLQKAGGALQDAGKQLDSLAGKE